MAEPLKCCGRCWKVKPLLSGFHRSTGSSDGRQAYCIDCNNSAVAFHINVNRPRNQNRVWGMFGFTCAWCGRFVHFKDGELHHLDRALKKSRVSDLMCRLWSPRLEAELKKCVLVHAGCHDDVHKIDGYKNSSQPVF
jgi:hypothetical protein